MSMDAEDSPDRPSSRPRKSRDDAKRETREALITAGITAFAEEGLDAPSLDSICARAGYTRGAFYVHFKDRDDFLIAVITSVLESFLDAIIATGDAALDLQKTIDTFVQAAIAGTFPMKNKNGMQFHQFMAACARSPHVRTQYVEVLRQGARRAATAVREGQGAGTVRNDVSPDSIATILTVIVLGVESLLEVEYPLDIVPAANALSAMLKPR
jgi:TetR/AcrR family transcriptional regulator, transcriptional repressor for nem operon